MCFLIFTVCFVHWCICIMTNKRNLLGMFLPCYITLFELNCFCFNLFNVSYSEPCIFRSHVRTEKYIYFNYNLFVIWWRYNNNNNNNTYLYNAPFTLCSNALLKNTFIPLLNTDRSYTEKMKIFTSFFVMESTLWIFHGRSFHNLAAEVPKRRFPNRMDLFLFLYGTVVYYEK